MYVLLATFAIVMAEGAAETASGERLPRDRHRQAGLAGPVTVYVGAAFLGGSRARRWPRWYLASWATIVMLGALLAMPTVRNVLLIRDHSGDRRPR